MNNLLLTTDFSELARTAYPTAAALAREYDSKILLVHAVNPSPALYGPPRVGPCPQLMTLLEEEIAHPALKGLDVEPHLIYDESSQKELLRFSREHNTDLIVMATHGRTGLRHFLLGSYTERIVQCSSVPVLTYRRKQGATEPYVPRRVLVPFDFSENAEVVFPTVEFFAGCHSSDFTFLHVFAGPDEFFYTRFPTQHLVEDWRRRIGREALLAQTRFEELLQSELPGIQATFETRHGTPEAEIVERARELGADLILMATHGWTGINHFLLGSVAEKVVRRAPCSVWTVRPRQVTAGARKRGADQIPVAKSG